jgi:hypothetical protein
MDRLTRAVFNPNSRKRFLVAAGLSLLLGTAALWEHGRRNPGFAFNLFRHHSTHDGIDIYGDAKFVHMIDISLQNLQERSPIEYSVIRPFVGRIEQASRSGASPWNDPPTIYMSAKSAFHSQTWCSGSIAHEGYHLLLYQQHLNQDGTPVPDSVWRGQQAELKCITFQLAVAKNVGAPLSDLEYLASLDGTHYDLDGDGKETWSDYWARDW